VRLDNLKKEYQEELVPLQQERDSIAREIKELKAVRDVFLEETTSLNARNEELAKLSAQYTRRLETAAQNPSPPVPPVKEAPHFETRVVPERSSSLEKARGLPVALPTVNSLSTASSHTLGEDAEVKLPKMTRHDSSENSNITPRPQKFMKWPGSRARDAAKESHASDGQKGRGKYEHTFQQLTLLRFANCEHCGDKMFGSQSRCSGKSIIAPAVRRP
jgi:regulator of replication initiation timing